MFNKILRAAQGAAVAVPLAFFILSSPASAQTCAYDSTQGACACPTSGAGTSCFGGQLFRSSDNSCQNDVRPCASNQNWSCTTESCVCNTASYPCGGCTAASSTIGATCAAPTNGRYTNVCGACGCPSGTTICSSSNTCVTTLSCPAGTTFDPCTNTCGTPNVLLSPGWIQSGFIQVNGDMKSTGGNLRMDSATGVGQGDMYIANGKAIRVDGSGVTSLSIGNWGVGGSSVNVFQNGNHFAFGMSTIPGDNAVASNTIETGNICLGNGINCRSSWPNTGDFDAAYVNVTGDTMTGDLNLTGASTDFFVAGKGGIGTTAPVNKFDVGGSAVIGAAFAGITAAPANGLLVQGATAIGPGALSYAGHLLDVTAAGPITTSFVSFRDNASGVELDFSRSGIKALGSNFVLDTDSGDVDINTAGASKLFIQRTASGGNVGIGTTTPGAKLEVNGGAKMTALQLTAGAAAGRFLVSDASGNASWSAASVVTGSGTVNYVPKFNAASTLGDSQIFDNGTGVGIGTASPAAGVKLDVNGAVKGSTFTNSASPIVTGNLLIQPASGASAMVVGTANATQFFQVQNNLGQAALNVDTTNMRVGIGTDSPGYTLHVSGDIGAQGQLYLSNGSPTEYFLDSDERSAMIQNNSNRLYVLRGCGTASGSWCQYNGQWPLWVDLENNDINLGGNLNFGVPNPTISATSYFVAPGGAYFNGGRVYTEAAIQARGGIHNDTAAALSIQGGTSGYTNFSGPIGVNGLTASSSYGVSAQGDYIGGYFTDTVYGGALYAGYYGYGMEAYGPSAAGYFYGGSSSKYTYIDLGHDGVYTNGWVTAHADNGYDIHMGGDSGGGDIEIGSATYGVHSLAMINNADGGRMDIYAGNYYNYSSIRFKDHVETIDGALDTLRQLRGVTFRWKDDAPSADKGKEDVGLIAEEVAKVYPIAVHFGEDGKAEDLAYTKLIPLLVQSVNEQQKEIEDLKAQIQELKQAIGR